MISPPHIPANNHALHPGRLSSEDKGVTPDHVVKGAPDVRTLRVRDPGGMVLDGVDGEDELAHETVVATAVPAAA
jgi:hypothetical protein